MTFISSIFLGTLFLNCIVEQQCSKLRTGRKGNIEVNPRKRNSDPSFYPGSDTDENSCACDQSPVIMDVIYPENYNKLEVPILKRFSNETTDDVPEKPLDIWVGVLIRKIREIDEIEEEVTIELDFVVSWMDKILFEANKKVFGEFENLTDEIVEKSMKTLDAAFLEKIWKPDLFIEHAVSISRSDLISQPVKLNFSPIGFIIYATRVTVKIDCDMEFQKYPADTQHCIFKIRSYAHTVKELKLHWMDPTNVFIFDRSDTNFDIKVSQVQILNSTEFHHLLYPNYSETYNILQFTLSARRRLSFHLLQTYIPTMFFIGITWLCFLVPPAMVEIRIGVAMTTLLTLTSMFSAVRESSPVTSYPKAVDIWIVACIFFIFATLLEFALLVWLRYAPMDDDELEASKKLVQLEEIGMEKLSFTKKLRAIHRQKDGRKNDKRFQNVAILLEEYAFPAFFLAFLFVQVTYWPWLLISSDYFNWTVDLQYNTIEE